MGVDKATLGIGGQPLWRHQVETLHALKPAQLLISGPTDGPYCKQGLTIIPDAITAQGPLGGMTSVLAQCDHPLVLILAVDMPRMTSAYLLELLLIAPGVSRRNGEFEPLAAVYPRDATATAAAEMLQSGHHSMRRLVSNLVAAGRMAVSEIGHNDASKFDNINTVEDLAHFRSASRES